MQNSLSDTRHTETIAAHGLRAVRLKGAGSEALIYLQGAHVASFRTAEHGELLWMSEQAVYAPGKALRGGIPICFPWFGAHPLRGELPAHGFARTLEFELEGSAAQGDSVLAELTLSSTPATLAWFPHPFRARLRVSVGRELSVAFEVENTGDAPLEYEVALHTYLSVSDVRGVELSGLGGATYDDKVLGARGCRQIEDSLRFTAETDRVYDSTSRVAVLDPARKRRLVVDKTCSGTTVVWNPWIEKAKRMSDLPDDGWPGMLCVETANTGAHRIPLLPASRHTTTTIISAETS